MIEIIFTEYFLRKFKKLNSTLQDEIEYKIEEFRNKKNHKRLKVHKLSNPFTNQYSFSVNYKVRIIFMYNEPNKKAVFLLTVGNHDIYKK